MTLGTPHCGYIHSNSKLLSTGIWLAEKFTKDTILSQIRLSDATSIKETYLYGLSKEPCISYFQKVILVGSKKDTYACLETSTIQPSQQLRELPASKSLMQMQKRLLGQIAKCQVVRLNVNTVTKANTFDDYIGRQAHIQFIDNTEVIKLIFK